MRVDVLILHRIGERGEVVTVELVISGKWLCRAVSASAIIGPPEVDVQVRDAAIARFTRRRDDTKE